ncbi:hypothetical protein GCM10025792_47650 [Pseudonocardia tropica]
MGEGRGAPGGGVTARPGRGRRGIGGGDNVRPRGSSDTTLCDTRMGGGANVAEGGTGTDVSDKDVAET